MNGPNSSGLRSNTSGNILSGKDNSSAFSVILVALSILIVLSNATLLALYILKSNLRSKKNFLLASLALSDLFSGSIVLPVHLSCNAENGRNINVCLVSSAILFRFLAISTILHILAITYEKYLSIIHPFYHQGFIHKKHLRVVSCSIWVTSLGLSLLPLAWFFEVNREAMIRKELTYFIFTFTGLFILPLILMIFAHIRMFKTISKSLDLICGFKKLQLSNFTTKPKENTLNTELDLSRHCSSNTKKVIKPIALMLGTFVACWLTWYLGVFLFYLDIPLTRQMPALSNVLHILVFLPSLINPMLYTYYKQDFRNEVKLLFKPRRRSSAI